jgi:hypothetical protein
VNYDHQKSWMQAFMSFDGKNHNFFLLLFLKPQHNENSSERKALSEQSWKVVCSWGWSSEFKEEGLHNLKK